MAMVTIEESDDEKSIVTPNCRLVFRRIEERWTHAIEAGSGPQSAVFAESVEADAAQDDFRQMASPVYQDLHIHKAELDYVFMLVGQFGPRHFSAAITVRYTPGWNTEDRTPGPQSTELEFDVAQRCRERIEHLASTYRIAGDAEVEECWLRLSRCEKWGEFVQARLNMSDSPMATISVGRLNLQESHVEFARKLLPTQSNGRLVYTWSVDSQE